MRRLQAMRYGPAWRCLCAPARRLHREWREACVTMWERHQRGEPPESFAVLSD